MIDQRQSLLDRCCPPGFGMNSAFDHDHVKPQSARRNDFSIGGHSTTILAHDHVDMQLFEKLFFRLCRKWTAIKNIVNMRYQKWRIDRLNAADHIMMLRQNRKGICLLPPNGQKYAARLLPKHASRSLDRGNSLPSIFRFWFPCRPFKPQQGQACLLRSKSGIARNPVGKWMCGIDQQVEPLRAQIIDKSSHTAKTADTRVRCLKERIVRSPCQRQRNHKIITQAEALCQLARFRRSGQNKDTPLVQM